MRGFRRCVTCNAPTFFKIMISKPDKIVKRIIKAVGVGQSALVIGEWQEDLIKGIKEKQNIVTQCMSFPGLDRESSYINNDDSSLDSRFRENDKEFPDNTFTRIIVDYDSPIFNNEHSFFNEARRLLLPTGMIIVSANCVDGIFDKIFKIFKREHIKEEGLKKIKPKTLQNQIHDHGFLIDGYYGYPGGHLLMMAQIINKEVTTLFNTEKQETIKT